MLDDKSWVSTSELAEVFGTDPSNTRRWLVQAAEEFGIERVKARGERGATMLVWRAEDANRLVQLRKDRGYALGRNTAPETPVKAEAAGCVYLLRLDPDLPNRIKCGYSTNLRQRLASHRTIAPRLEVLMAWECAEWAERAALAALAAMSEAERIGEEVFDLPADQALERLTMLFGLLGAKERR